MRCEDSDERYNFNGGQSTYVILFNMEMFMSGLTTLQRIRNTILEANAAASVV
jgi:hypothetical protein